MQALLGVSGINIDVQKYDGVTALHLAALNGNYDVVKALIDKRADVNVGDEDGWTALMYASKKGHLTTVQALLDVSGIDINARDYDGSTALYLAVLKGNNDVVKALINKGADVNFDDADDLTVLMKYLAQRQANVGDLRAEATWASTFATSAIPPKASQKVIPSLQALELDTLIQQARVEGPSLLQISFQANRDQLLQHKLSAAQVGDLIRLLHNSPFASALVQTLALAIKLGGYHKKSDLNLIHEKLNVFDLFDAYKKVSLI